MIEGIRAVICDIIVILANIGQDTVDEFLGLCRIGVSIARSTYVIPGLESPSQRGKDSSLSILIPLLHCEAMSRGADTAATKKGDILRNLLTRSGMEV